MIKTDLRQFLFLKIKWELLQMHCEICERISEKVWDVEKSVIPNRYYDSPNQTAYFQQETYFCQNCNFIFNKHPISEEEMFKDYVYRSPDTSDDINAVNLILSLIKDKNIKTISEVGGNNGVFAKKILSRALNIDRYDIWDMVETSQFDPRLHFQNQYLTEKTNPLEVDLVIVRHAFAHNASVAKFAHNIIKKFNPKFIYIECADWNKTLFNRDFSQLYSEHFYCLSGRAVANLFVNYNFFRLKEVSLQIHNGSFGLLLGKMVNAENDVSYSEQKNISSEIQNWVKDVTSFWNNLVIADLNIWGCSAKFVFTINALELKNVDDIRSIIDSTQGKHNKFPPGMRCMVASEPKKINKNKMVFIVGARNFAAHIENKISGLFPNSSVIVPPF